MCCSTLTYWQGTGRRFGSRMWVCCYIAEERRAMARRLSHCVVNTDRGEWRKMGWRVSDRLLYVNDQRLVPAETFRKTGRLHGGLTKSFRCRKKRRQRHLMAHISQRSLPRYAEDQPPPPSFLRFFHRTKYMIFELSR
jgi:hypothetical protein